MLPYLSDWKLTALLYLGLAVTFFLGMFLASVMVEYLSELTGSTRIFWCIALLILSITGLSFLSGLSFVTLATYLVAGILCIF